MRKRFNKVEGLQGEFNSCDYLKKKKYKILEQNYKNRIGEIDIIAQYKGCIVFVEVKSRQTLKFGRPSEAVDKRKQQKIRRVANLYLIQNHLMDNSCRFDVIEVIAQSEINHIENAF